MSKKITKATAIKNFTRDENGLLAGAEYQFNEDGSVDWRSMVKPEFLYVNKEWFTNREKDVPSSVEGLTDKQLLILLGGIKDIAKLRGYKSVSYDLSGDSENVVAKCRIEWSPNYETGGESILFEDCANASLNNTDNFCHKFLETIACNRAFVRCVRNFLGINIVGDDEIDKSGGQAPSYGDKNSETSAKELKPQGFLEKLARDKGYGSFEEFKSFLRERWKDGSYKNEEIKEWASYDDISAKECRKIMTLLNK
ncbi:hypothetical protein N9955_00865 [bacterium]|nr:hypothetical protein [bacterium]